MFNWVVKQNGAAVSYDRLGRRPRESSCQPPFRVAFASMDQSEEESSEEEIKQLEDSLEALAILKDFSSPWPLDGEGMPVVDDGRSAAAAADATAAVRSSDGDAASSVSRADVLMVFLMLLIVPLTDELAVRRVYMLTVQRTYLLC